MSILRGENLEKYLVGIFSVPKYQSEDITDLPFCAKDGIELKEVFNNHLGIEDEYIRLVGDDLDQEVSKADILKNVIQLRRIAEPDDIIIFYFSGHGFSENNVGYLATSDTDLDIASDTSIPINRIREELNKSVAKIKILIIDSCYSGIGTGKKFDNKMSEDFEKSLFSDISEGWVIFASCTSNEMSYSLENESLSVFTSYLIEGLKGNADTDKDSIISFEDLRIYVTKMVSKWSIDNNKIQTPNINMQLVGRLAFTIKNPEASDVFSMESEFGDFEKTAKNLVLTSIYRADRYRQILEDLDGIYCPTGQYEEIPLEKRKNNADIYIKNSSGKLFSTILQYFKTSQIKYIDDGEFELPFGRFIRKSISPIIIEDKLIISKDLFTPTISDLLNSLDEQKFITWDSIEYTFNGIFNFDIIQEIAKEKDYTILEFFPDNYSLVIAQEEGSILKNVKWKISFENDNQLAILKIFQDNGLDKEFFQTIPITELIDIFSASLGNT